MVKKVIILASGGGTNAQNIIQYFKEHDKINVHSVLCNRKEAEVYERVNALGIHCQWFDASNDLVLVKYMKEFQPHKLIQQG